MLCVQWHVLSPSQLLRCQQAGKKGPLNLFPCSQTSSPFHRHAGPLLAPVLLMWAGGSRQDYSHHRGGNREVWSKETTHEGSAKDREPKAGSCDCRHNTPAVVPWLQWSYQRNIYRPIKPGQKKLRWNPSSQNHMRMWPGMQRKERREGTQLRPAIGLFLYYCQYKPNISWFCWFKMKPFKSEIGRGTFTAIHIARERSWIQA